ncbi:hypothetical protein [Brasilonema bromeliae]|uniref:Bacteriocin n=1 Tax=Brasilonema bromeliae SPC951 TaxID=385972 RepID=A0ABX1P3I0_9CYAN|nr:hypothetical protein [Brasilonema bromeliae]NMG18899.1 hypothetical protein [Brasilonema bromeliae SPC951]
MHRNINQQQTAINTNVADKNHSRQENTNIANNHRSWEDACADELTDLEMQAISGGAVSVDLGNIGLEI